MERSFEFVRQLVESERYKNYKKEFWGGADVIFATPNILDKEGGRRLSLRNRLEEWDKDSFLLVETKYASAVIWLIESLKPCVNLDYLSKYEYYKNIGVCVMNNKDAKDEKDLLFKILDNGQVSKWEKRRIGTYVEEESISKFRWKEWYNYGIENNDPFFVKFMTLWIAFNQLYSKFSGDGDKQNGERVQIMKLLQNDEKEELLTKELFDRIFKSPFVDIFKDNPVCSYDRIKKEFVPDSYKNNEIVRDTNERWQERIKALFMMIYQVRCNLFHGSKEVSEPRDVKLVKCAGEIIEMYLEGTSERPYVEYNMVSKEEK